jgi:hypothetical protein
VSVFGHGVGVTVSAGGRTLRFVKTTQSPPNFCRLCWHAMSEPGWNSFLDAEGVGEPRHVEVARAISAAAASRGARSDRSAVREVQVAIASLPDAVDVGFWREVLGYAAASGDNGVDPLGRGSTVWMQEPDGATPFRHPG